jgi:hypothetical protein
MGGGRAAALAAGAAADATRCRPRPQDKLGPAVDARGGVGPSYAGVEHGHPVPMCQSNALPPFGEQIEEVHRIAPWTN